MSEWSSGELENIATADELRLAPVRSDGTLRKPVTIWVVQHGDDLYVRSINGRTSSWFRGVQDRHEGHIQAGVIEKDVTYVDVGDADSGLTDQLDAGYRSKYRRYAASIVNTTVTPHARAATIRLVPRS